MGYKTPHEANRDMSRVRIVATISCVLALLVYVAIATERVHGVDAFARSIAFLIGPLALIGTFQLIGTFESSANANHLRFCRVFLGSAFVLLTTMVVIQQTTLLQFAILRSSDVSTASNEIDLIQFGVNIVQLGLDVAFDIHYCVGVILFASLIYRHPAFGRVIGLLGIAIASGLLALNLVAFPVSPSAAGFPDLGPLTALWWLGVIVLQLRRIRHRHELR